MNKPVHATVWWKALCILLFIMAISTSALFAQLPAGFVDAKMQDGYTSPMGIVFSKDGKRMFVWEKAGKIWCSDWNGTTYVKNATPFLDISEEAADWRDFGLLSMCIDPNFDTNGLIYLFYMVDRHHLLNFGTPQYSATTDDYFKPSICRVTRYKINLGATLTTDYASRKILLGESKTTGIPLVHETHGGGTLIFGTDGTLLLATGDFSSYTSTDKGSASETYFQQAITDNILRPQENVGAFRAQMNTSHCGKILRFDPNTGDGVSSNPYYDAANPRTAKSRVWATGLRNPFKMSLWPGTGVTNPATGNPGTLLVGDVGWNTYEDFHIIDQAGLNCGWPLYEGQTAATGYYGTNVPNQDEGNQTFENLCKQPTSAVVNATPSQRRYTHSRPALAYKHGADEARVPAFTGTTPTDPLVGATGASATGVSFGGNCIIGGVFYTGTAFGAAYQNKYFFADYAQNFIRTADLHATGDHWVHSVANFAPVNYANGIIAMTQGPLENSIFYINLNANAIQKISLGGNRPPVAAIAADKLNGLSPLVVNLSSAGSSDPDNDPITYLWDFGDGTTSTLANPSHTFSATGTRGFTVKLTVSDNKGLSDSKTLVISVNNTPPSVVITNPINNAKYSLNQSTLYTLKSTVTDSDTTGMKYAWQVVLRHNNHEHFEPVNNQATPTVPISPIGCDGETYYFYIELTVTDNGGLTAKDSVKLYPDCATANLPITNLAATPQPAAVQLTWTNPTVAFDELLVVARPTTGFLTNPSSTTTYAADVSYTGTGTAFEGGKVVYKGIGNAVTVTNLTGNTKYFFRVYTRKGTAWTGGVEASATPTIPCLTATYFKNMTLTAPAITTRTESNIDNDWGLGAPNVAGVPIDTFSIRYEGTIMPPVTGAYVFTATVDDGVRLWVNGVLVIDKWLTQPPTTYTATVNLTANTPASVKMEYFENYAGALAKLFWTVPNQVSKPVAFLCTSCAPLTNSAGTKTNVNNAGWVTNTTVTVNTGTSLSLGANPSGLASYVWTGPASFSKTGTANEVVVSTAVTTAQAGNYTVVMTDANNCTATKTIAVAVNPLIFDPAKCYQMVARHSGKTLEVAGAATTNGAKIQQNAYTAGAKAQLWKMKDNGDGTYRIVNANSGKIMDASTSTASGVNTVQWDWASFDNQKWSFAKNTEGYYNIKVKHTGQALTVLNAQTTNAAPCVQVALTNATNQQFTVSEVVCPAGVVALQSPNLLMVEGQRVGKTAVINWVSNSNAKGDYFLVQRLGYDNFEHAQYFAAQNSNDPTLKQLYTFTDNQPKEGENIYRVLLYRDGVLTPQYSELIILDFSSLTNYMLYPNPANDYVDIEMESGLYRSADIEITNALGKAVISKHIDKVVNPVTRLQLDGLESGQYYVRIQVADKKEVVKKLTIMR
jgi:glucose/arabinose dehydrogenase